MIFADILFPCLTVFSVAVADFEPALDAAADTVRYAEADVAAITEVSAPTIEDDADEGVAGMEAPYSAEIQPAVIDTPENDVPESAPPPVVFDDKSDDEVFQLVSEYLQSIETMSATFIQTAPSGNVSTGTLQLSRPGRLRFEFDDPNPTLIVATQGLVYVHDADLETTDSYPVSKTPLKFLLSRKIKTDDAVLEEVFRDEASVNLILKSDDPETEGQLILVLDAPDFKLRRWAVVDGMDNYTIVELDNLEEGVRIPNRAFRIPDAGGAFTRDR